jgi:ribosomal protein S18 acetylase RimI-like enzyme
MPFAISWGGAESIFEPVDLTAELGEDAPAVLDLEYTASEPYTRFVFSSVDQALSVRRYLFERGLCEFSPPYLRVLRQDGRVLGMLAVLTGADVVRCRLRAALALMKGGLLGADMEVTARLKLAGRTLMQLDAEDFYISRIAASAAARGRGLGRLMLGAAEGEARARGCHRLALEVAPESGAAVRLYRSQGFEQVAARQVSDAASGRRLEYLHMVKPLDASGVAHTDGASD